ncbi:MAG TPA: family 78 glycoside hydrolase catalytic domain, partial [Puia sp.]
LLYVLFLPVGTVFAQLSVKNLRCENLINPIGIDIPIPRFSWQLISRQRDVLQIAYEIQVTDRSGKINIWNSGKQMSAQSLYVPFAGPGLRTATAYYWKIRVWDNKGEVSGWSQNAFWQMGFLKTSDWKAEWIESESAADTVNGPALLFRKSFSTRREIISATAFISAHGLYEAFINGHKIGNAFLTPGWTSYNKRLQYQVYDVTNLVSNGKNVMGVHIGSGWYRTNLAWNNNRNIYGKKIGLLLQLEISYADGTRETITSDSSWKTSDQGPVRSSEIYNGEVYDASRELKKWDEPDYDDQGWQNVIEKNYPKNNLLAAYNEPVRMHERFKAVRVFKTPKGELVIDFGQNLVGWETITLNGRLGDTITVDHAEVLDKEGNFYTDNLRAAKARNIYILKSGKENVLTPHFTFQGFRYIRLKGFSGEFTSENIFATAMYSDMNATGQFTCSNPLLNQLQHNIQWGQKGNFLDVPTDCPQRDERLGWTGDAQAFSKTACYNMDVHNFFSKWLKDVAADQGEDGRVPFVIPNVLGQAAGGSAGWADVCTIIPWNLWLC